MKLLDILKEIGEGSKEPYAYETVSSEDLDYSTYKFTTEENVVYKMTVNKFKNKSNKLIDYDVEFGIVKSKPGGRSSIDFKSTSKDTKTGNMYRIMSTVVDIIKKEMTLDKQKFDHTLDKIVFSPTKEDESDNRRLNLYAAYIQKQIPGSKISPSKFGSVTVKLAPDVD